MIIGSLDQWRDDRAYLCGVWACRSRLTKFFLPQPHRSFVGFGFVTGTNIINQEELCALWLDRRVHFSIACKRWPVQLRWSNFVYGCGIHEALYQIEMRFGASRDFFLYGRCVPVEKLCVRNALELHVICVDVPRSNVTLVFLLEEVLMHEHETLVQIAFLLNSNELGPCREDTCGENRSAKPWPNIC